MRQSSIKVPRISGVLLESEAEDGNLLISDGVEQFDDDLIGKSSTLPSVDFDNLEVSRVPPSLDTYFTRRILLPPSNSRQLFEDEEIHLDTPVTAHPFENNFPQSLNTTEALTLKFCHQLVSIYYAQKDGSGR